MSSNFLSNKYKPLLPSAPTDSGIKYNPANPGTLAYIFVDSGTGENVAGLILNYPTNSSHATLWMASNLSFGMAGSIVFKPIARYPLISMPVSRYIMVPIYGQVEYYYYGYLLANWDETKHYLGQIAESARGYFEERINILQELIDKESAPLAIEEGPTLDEFLSADYSEFDDDWAHGLDTKNKKPN